MPKSTGKMFEEDIKKSIPTQYFVYRLKDGTAGFAGARNENVRFQATNICDYIVFANGWVHLLELKSHKGASIPISPIYNDKGKIIKYGVIKVNQLDGLLKEHDKEDINGGFIFNLSDKEKTWFVDVLVLKTTIDEGLKSLSLDWLNKYGTLIPQEKKRTRYRYDLSVILD